MKKTAAILCAAVMLLTSGCTAINVENVNIVNELPETISVEDSSENNDMESMAPSTMRIDITVDDLPLLVKDLDFSSFKEILFADITFENEEFYVPDSLAGADLIVQMGDRYCFLYTEKTNSEFGEEEDSNSKRVSTAILVIPTENDLYFAFYSGDKIEYLMGGTKAWYFDNCEIDYMVYSHYNSVGTEICSFYNAAGSKVFTRLGAEYFGPDFEPLSDEKINQYKDRYGESLQFSAE